MGIFKTQTEQDNPEKVRTKYGLSPEQMQVIAHIKDSLKNNPVFANDPKPLTEERIIDTLRRQPHYAGKDVKLDTLLPNFPKMYEVFKAFNERYKPDTKAGELNDAIIQKLQAYNRSH